MESKWLWIFMEKSPTITKRVIDGGRTERNFMFTGHKNSSGYTNQVSLSFAYLLQYREELKFVKFHKWRGLSQKFVSSLKT